jgi:SecD/SecF fusion protein
MSDYVNAGKRALFGLGDIDFLKYRNVCYTLSGLLILIGLIATFLRGREILDIDFNGGTSVVFVLDKGLEPDKVREIATKAFSEDKNGLPIQTTLTNVEMKEFDKNSVYKLDVSLKDEADVKDRLLKNFSGASGVSLVTYDMDAKILGTSQSNWLRNRKVQMVSYQDPAAAPADAQTPTATPEQPATPAATTDPVAPPVAEATSIPPSIGAAEVAPTTPTIYTNAELTFRATKGEGAAKLNSSQVAEGLVKAALDSGKTLVEAQIELEPTDATNWNRSSDVGYTRWNAKLPFDEPTTSAILSKMAEQVRTKPVFQSFSKIEGRVAGEMQQRAIAGLLLSLVFITMYIWFRFNKVSYGIAAVIALVHDVLITIAFIAISHWLFKPLGFLLLDDFKISLTIVAAILTIIGYSLNDTIVVFDRIREVKGKSPNLTEKMINASVTQTLSRTLLTSSTTIVAILLMYIWGGEGIHGFAFCLLIGILVGTYSSIFVAAPILLWLSKREQAARAAAKVS